MPKYPVGKTKRQALNALASINASLDQDTARFDSYTIDAPAGYIFKANLCESYFIGDYDPAFTDAFSKPQIWAEIVAVCAMGLQAQTNE